MNSKTNLQKLREHLGLTPEQLAQKTGVSAAKISSAESGESDLATEELYDLALYFQTGTSDLMVSEELATTTHVDYPGNEDYDGFWGHVGILLHGQKHTKWYPITTTASDDIWEDLQNHESGFIAIRTLNNRVLFVNPRRVKKIMLNDDDADAPPDFEDVASYMSPASYEAIREWYWESIGAGETSYSSNARKLVEALLKEEGLDEGKIEEVMLKTFVYYRDGSSESYQANSSHLANIWAFGQNLSIPVISLPEQNDLFYCWYSGEAVALIDTPYLELEESRGEKMTSLGRRGRRRVQSIDKETERLAVKTKGGKGRDKEPKEAKPGKRKKE